MTKIVEGQTDIFSMFGIVDEVAEEQKRKEEERKKYIEELNRKAEQSKSASTKKKEEKDTFAVNENTVIRYFGESLEIQQYFSAEEIAEGVLRKTKNGEERVKIDGEMLRKRMEKDYPELIKGMTDMVYLKDKNIVVPVMKAKKKGNCMETSSTSEDVSLRLPRIGFNILQDFISIAKIFALNKLEIHADVYFDTSNKKYFLDFPEQKVSKYWCEVTEDSESIARRLPYVIKVMEIHSHHEMAPIPSLLDNRAEIVPGMLYAIVGYVHKPFPEITIRRRFDFGDKQGWIPLKFHDVFEDPFLSLPTFDFNKIEVVSE